MPCRPATRDRWSWPTLMRCGRWGTIRLECRERILIFGQSHGRPCRRPRPPLQRTPITPTPCPLSRAARNLLPFATLWCSGLINEYHSAAEEAHESGQTAVPIRNKARRGQWPAVPGGLCSSGYRLPVPDTENPRRRTRDEWGGMVLRRTPWTRWTKVRRGQGSVVDKRLTPCA